MIVASIICLDVGEQADHSSIDVTPKWITIKDTCNISVYVNICQNYCKNDFNANS